MRLRKATKAEVGASRCMPRIVTTCPTTGQTVPTGYRSADLDLEQLAGPMSFRCTACEKVHAWTAMDVSIEETSGFIA